MKMFLAVLLAMGLFSGIATANKTVVEKLPAPQRSGGMALMDALNKRASIKEFAKKDIDKQTLSDILWAAYGVNRPNGKRTIPTSRGKNDLDVYVAKSDGVWFYDANENSLKLVLAENILFRFNNQDYMKDVPIILFYTGSKNNAEPAMHAGSAFQNVGLYSASKGLNNVVRGNFDKAKTHKLLSLSADKEVIISQVVGWGKQ